MADEPQRELNDCFYVKLDEPRWMSVPLGELAEFGFMPAGQRIGEHEGVALAGLGLTVTEITPT
ncbi:hypothetical protein SGGMMB4_05255 [Sodalis glossinidius str. 'morsitans']|uniref:Uncharacterized protein n=1 Tax=Sodalis glossinidius (strain morsitans) TaxID=343509 RepID=A0A193QEZ4_SODGM|nr:hypothetical protein SGGMMB4_00245 [Sodalis glossinidius str. 'morsitans']CRL46528.1 hypothetical protein SGGMMB4_05255 [Sodalis glossinidius str. 'morsitans']